MPQPGVARPQRDRDDRGQALRPDDERRAPWRDTPGSEREIRSSDRATRGSEPVRSAASAERGIAGRRTVTIHGRGAERYVPRRAGHGRRHPQRRYERAGFRPDRAAMWAVLLGVMLMLAAAASAHAATWHALAGLH